MTPNPTSMVERVARALCVADRLDPDADWRYTGDVMLTVAIETGKAQRWRIYTSKARAAIAAMKITDVVYWVDGRPNASPADVDWNARIDAALKEGE